MAYYTKLQENEIREIADRYGLKVTGYEPIEEGAGNTNYLVKTAQEQYILTVFEIDYNRVRKLRNLLSLLKKHTFPTTRIQRLANGDAITSHRGKPILLKRYICGRVIQNLSEAMLRQVGAAMAALHQIPSPETLPDNHSYVLDTLPRVMEKGVNRPYENWLAEKYKALRRGMPPDNPRGLIHGDIFYDNLLFEGQKLQAIIDFEDACRYYFIFDLGMAVVGSCTKNSKIILSKVRALIEGYQKIRVLIEGEKESFHRFIEYAAIATSSWRFWKYNIDTLTPEKADTYLDMVKIAKDARSGNTKKYLKSLFA